MTGSNLPRTYCGVRGAAVVDARGGPVAGIGAKAGQSLSRGAGVVRTVNGQGCVVGREDLCEVR